MRKQLNWAMSKTVGGITEIAVLAPVKKGTVPTERRTYEERLVAVIDNLADRHRRGLPTELSRIPAIHFGRLILIRPEQYLLHSRLSEVEYESDPDLPKTLGGGRVPRPIDDYAAETRTMPQGDLRTFLLTLVEFDGDLKVYMREIAKFIGSDFDRVFENCEGYPTSVNFERFWLWVRRYQINTNLFYAPYSNLSVVRIKQLEDFKRRFDAFVTRVRPAPGQRVGSIDELFDEFLRENQQRASDFPTAGGVFKTSK
ncbi:hypothetical protein JQ628_14445 [Bradyrhizobium lablabi]|uniref:hypothetical protein n=1 Tax=Bradyrhizobium lablabi TaxID=722472 RepID=UPI001BA450ED|nr:hypothetical protein [Bradyrhizobium lablabi]MBR1122724.1 hypothetical protein [Bradyrhizobium lablabi]